VIINLVDKVVEAYSHPTVEADEVATYGNNLILKPGDIVEFSTPDGQHLAVEVASLLP
jgi:hypothetical protein